MRSDCSEEQSDQGQHGLENDTLQKHGWKLEQSDQGQHGLENDTLQKHG